MSGFLLDTNVVSELIRPEPSERVVGWVDAVDEETVFLSVVTLAELRRGVERLEQGRRRHELATWLSDALPARFEGRFMDVDAEIADQWGVLMASTARLGRPLGAMDAFFAATARARDLTLVTRNDKDFGACDITVLNPWTDNDERDR